MLSFAAIDIGSNAIRMAIASQDQSGNLNQIATFRESVRLGHDVFHQAAIGDDTFKATVAALSKFKEHLDRHQVRVVKAVATSAMREAKNKTELVDAIQERTGIRVSVIPGHEEARLVKVAVTEKINLKKKLALLIDIGGGSIEISLVRNNNIIVSDSVKMGTVRLMQLLDERRRGQKLFNRLVKEYASGLKRQLKKEIGGRAIEICIGTGGNVESLASLKSQLIGKSKDDSISRRDLESILESLQDLTYQERIDRLSLKPDRADVIVPAGLVLQAILKHSGAKEMLVPGVGLKDGLLIEMAKARSDISDEQHRRQVIAYAFELGKRYDFDAAHGAAVRKLANDLFEQTKKQLGLAAEARLMLEVAALLHDIGRFISASDHHKHSEYIVRATPIVGLSTEERHMVSLICRYHRKTGPRQDHATFRELSKENQELVTKLSAILRIADALDQGHAGAVTSVRSTFRGGKFLLNLKGRGDLLLERWAVLKKADLFSDISGLVVEIED